MRLWEQSYLQDNADIWGASGNRSSVDEGKVDGPEDETTVVEPEQGNGQSWFKMRFHIPEGSVTDEVLVIVLSHIISQLRPGADLSRVVLPTFILEPRSMLERITKCVWSAAAVGAYTDMGE